MEAPVSEGVVLGGRYRLDRLLGRGGMAQVYDGRDVRLDRAVAIKLLRPELAADAGLRQRFEREAQAAARLSHPNVVAVFDAGEDAGRAYIIMERLGGESMADVVGRGPMDLAWLRRTASDVLAALGAAHRAGIIHRDIKPANILIGADGRAKVADFGIARVVEERDAAEFARGLTATGTVIGTPAYLAPERAMGHPATPQSDLYSVGVVLYEALTGRKPFDGATPLAIAAAASNGPSGAPNPVALRPDADADLVVAIARAMAADPARRYPSASAMAAAIRGEVGSPATEVMAADEVAAHVADTVAVVGPGGTQRPPGPSRPRPGRRPPSSGRRHHRTWTAVVAAAVLVLAAIAIASLANQGGSRAGSASQPTTVTTVGATKSTLPATTTPAAEPPTTAAAGLDASLLALAGRLGPNDGTAYRQLVTGLDRIASLPAIARPGSATQLLAQATSWYKEGKLSDAAFGQAVALLTLLSAQPLTPPTDPGKGRPNGSGGGTGGD